VGRRVAEEQARGGSRGEFVGCCGTEIWIAEATEHTKGGIIQELLME